MWYGGARMIKLYQCGLTEAGLYSGEIDGIWRPELPKALETMRAGQGLRPVARRRAVPRGDVVIGFAWRRV